MWEVERNQRLHIQSPANWQISNVTLCIPDLPRVNNECTVIEAIYCM